MSNRLDKISQMWYNIVKLGKRNLESKEQERAQQHSNAKCKGCRAMVKKKEHKKSKVARSARGLKLSYKVDGNENYLADRYETIEQFANTELPKKNTELALRPETKLTRILWNNKAAELGDREWTAGELQELIKSGNCKIVNNMIYDTTGKQMIGATVRKSVHSIDEVREAVKDVMLIKRKDESRIEFDGDIIKGNSQRYQTFFTKGTKCVCCGLEGRFFAKERTLFNKSFHLELYGIDENGVEVLFTKDHIIPASRGGESTVDNYQTMCVRCNIKKGNKLETETKTMTGEK